jgi:hypothetical protein
MGAGYTRLEGTLASVTPIGRHFTATTTIGGGRIEVDSHDRERRTNGREKRLRARIGERLARSDAQAALRK